MSLCSEFQKEESQFEKMIKTVPPGRAPKVRGFHNLECVPTNGTQASTSMGNSWRLQQSQTWALQESDTENHSGLKEPLVGILDKRPKQLVMLSLSSKQSMLLSNVRDLLLSKDLVVQNFLFNGAVSESPSLQRNMKGNYSNISKCSSSLKTCSSLDDSIISH